MTRSTRAPRVLMVVGAYAPEIAGGSLQCRTLVHALADRVRFSIFTTTSDRAVAIDDRVDGVPVRRMFVDAKRPITKLTAAGRLARLAPALIASHDVLHFHGFTEKMLPLVVAAKLGGRRTIEKMTSLGWDDPVSIRTRPRGRWLAAAMARVDRFVAINPAMEQRCEAAGVPRARVRLIPNGVDTARFAPVDAARRAHLRAQLGLPPSAIIVAFVGFWSREKGPHVLFEAWRAARAASGPPTALVYIGSTSPAHAEVDASLVAHVRDQIRAERLDDAVHFVEHTPAVEAYLQAADVFALPSTREGMSNALLEAMSSGVPSIATAIPGVTDAMIDDGVTGWVVPPDGTHVLADRLRVLFADADLRARVGRAARASVLARFSIGAVAGAYFSLYTELLSRST